MSGILDSKSRVIDTVITTEGRRQLSEGGIDIKYVSFSDSSTFYRADKDTGSEDATRRIYLESCQLPQDDIIFQSDGEGNVMPFKNADGIPVQAGRILQYSFTPLTASTLTGSTQSVKPLQGDAFTEQTRVLLGSSIDNFRKLYLIASKDKIFEDDGFGMGPDQITFTITNDRPINSPQQRTSHIGALDSLFSDPRFSNKQNFKFLPPTNKVKNSQVDRSDPRETKRFALGVYQPWGRTHVDGLSYDQVAEELNYYRDLGYCQTINFDPTSRENHLVGQFFERGYDTLKKLDVIDYGVHPTGNPNAPVAHVFFVGKTELDEKGTDTFIHIFTLVFE